MNNFEKAVEMNFRFIKDNCILFLGLAVIITVMSFMPMFSLFAPLIYLVMLILITYKAYYNVLEKTVVGSEAAIYNMLPLSVKENIWAKITALMFFNIFTLLVTVVSLVITMKFTAWQGMLLDIFDGLETMLSGAGIAGILLAVINLWVIAFMQVILLFYLFIRFGTQGNSKKKNFATGLFMLIYLILNRLSVSAYTFALVNKPVVSMPVVMVVEIVIAAVVYKMILKYFNEELAM